MSDYPPQLETSSEGHRKRKYTCPNCKSPKKFTRYWFPDTKEYIADYVGICDRINECKYHFNPKKYFRENKITPTYRNTPYIPKPKPIIAPSYIPESILNQSLKRYEQNHFVQFLRKLFLDKDVSVDALIDRYKIGTSKKWNCGTVFWQIDIHNNIRSGKLMQYNPDTGKRVKEGNSFGWVHTELKIPHFNLEQCLYGEHLLALEPNKLVAIVESEKSAIIASAIFPDYIWLATSGLQGITKAKFKALKDRHVVLWPDLKSYQFWADKAKELGSTCKSIRVTNYLEINATPEQKAEGLDIADYLIRPP